MEDPTWLLLQLQKDQTVSWLCFAETSKTFFFNFPSCLCLIYDHHCILTINTRENIRVYYKMELLDTDVQGIEFMVQNEVP